MFDTAAVPESQIRSRTIAALPILYWTSSAISEQMALLGEGRLDDGVPHGKRQDGSELLERVVRSVIATDARFEDDTFTSEERIARLLEFAQVLSRTRRNSGREMLIETLEVDPLYSVQLARSSGNSVSRKGLAEEMMMETITACWLALYFHGIRHDLLWSDVQTMAATKTHGFPDGVCNWKEMGDIYRQMRRRLKVVRDLDGGRLKSNFRMRQLAANPFLFKANDLDWSPDSDVTPFHFRAMGARYLLLQQVCYLRDDLPITLLWKTSISDLAREDEMVRRDQAAWFRNAIDAPSRTSRRFGGDSTPLWRHGEVFTKSGQEPHSYWMIAAIDQDRLADLAFPAYTLGETIGFYIIQGQKENPLPYSGRVAEYKLFDSLKIAVRDGGERFRSEYRDFTRQSVGRTRELTVINLPIFYGLDPTLPDPEPNVQPPD